MASEVFPVLSQQNFRLSERLKMPRGVPWAIVEPWREQAHRNHGQTLERLAERGGLSPEELWLAAHGLGIRALLDGAIDERKAIAWLESIIEQHYTEPRNNAMR